MWPDQVNVWANFKLSGSEICESLWYFIWGLEENKIFQINLTFVKLVFFK